MEAMNKLISFVTAFIMILSGCTTDDIIETDSSLKQVVKPRMIQ